MCKYARFPIGHPVVITENFETISAGNQPYFGLIYCRVKPPRKLFHPVLPVKHDSKLVFSLCRTCMEMKSQEDCDHTTEERALTGVWVSAEVDKALELGYKVEHAFMIYLHRVPPLRINAFLLNEQPPENSGRESET